MPKRSNDFQRLLYAIQASFASDATVTESGILIDKQTGAKTEVDIIVETVVNEFPVIISLEVRARKRPATVEWVREMLGKHSTLQTNKLILVSKSGFTKEAEDKAKENEIETLNIVEANLFDWSSKIKTLVEKTGLHIASFKMIATEFKIEFSELNIINARKSQEIISLSDIFYIPSRSESATVCRIPNLILRNDSIAVPIMNRWIKEGVETFTITWTPTTECYIENSERIKFPIKAIILKGVCEVERIPIKLEHGTFKNTQVAHATVRNIFSDTANENNAILSFVENENNQLSGVLVIPGTPTGSSSSVNQMKFKGADVFKEKT